jgi:hypothetical protein
VQHFIDRKPEDIAIDCRDAAKFIILAVAPNAFIDFRQMRHHSFDERLCEFAHP